MFCPNCGQQNADNGIFCVRCGSALQNTNQPQNANVPPQYQSAQPYSWVPPQTPKKRGKGLVIALICGGTALIAAAVVLIVLLTGGVSVEGVWYSKALGKVLEFKDNGVFRGYTAADDYKGEYEYDKGAREGIVIVDDEEFSFAVDENELVFEDMGTYKKADEDFDIDEFIGDVAVASAQPTVQPTPEPTVQPTPEPTVQPTPQTVTDQTMTLTFNYGERTGTYTGEIVDGLPSGYGTYSSANPEGLKWTYEGEWASGHFNGQGKSTFEDGYVCAGQYQNDFLNGDGSEYWQGALQYEGGYLDGIYHGQGTYYNIYGEAVYTGAWANGYIQETAEERSARVTAFKDSSVPVLYDELFGACQNASDIHACVQGVVFQAYEFEENEQYYGNFLMYEQGIEDSAHVVCVNYLLSEGEARVTEGQTVTVWGTPEYLYSYTADSGDYLTVPLVRAWSVE